MGWKSKKDGTHFNDDKIIRSSGTPGTEVNIEIDNNSDDFAEDVRKGFDEDDGEICSICGSKHHLIPKAGSGTVIHWVCNDCVNKRRLEVLPEYLENIEEFGHWYRG